MIVVAEDLFVLVVDAETVDAIGVFGTLLGVVTGDFSEASLIATGGGKYTEREEKNRRVRKMKLARSGRHPGLPKRGDAENGPSNVRIVAKRRW